MRGLAEVALLGTGRHTGEVPRTGTPVDALVDALEERVAEAGAEWRLLLAAGTEAVYREAGHAPLSAPPLPPAAEAERLPACAPGAAAVLRDILREHRALLPEALARLAQAGQRLPPALLPEALALRSPALREALVPVLGERGLWLARLHPEGAWVLMAAPESPAERTRRWEEGTSPERLEALRRERASDPTQARGWLEATWKQEKAEVRAAFVEALEVGLSPADEPLLEAALDDRSQAVRGAAARVLGQLPGSALARRMRERVQALLGFTPPPPGSAGLWGEVKARLQGESPAGVLHVAPPASLPRDWERDGITARPPQGVGERAHWLAQLLAAVPPAHLEARWGAAPEQLVRAASASEWSVALVLGWSRATGAFPSPGWAAPLWDFWWGLRQVPPGLDGEVGNLLVALLPRMAPAEAEARVLRVLEERAGRGLPLEAAVRALPAPWSEAFAGGYLRALERHLSGAGPTPASYLWPATLVPAACALPPSALPQALALLARAEAARLHSGWPRALDAFLSTLRIRQRLLEEIAP